MKHIGNLAIRTQADAEKYKGLTEVTGYLSIYAPAKLDAPKLKSIGGDLLISAPAKLDAPKLKSIGGDLLISASAKLDALESVGGGLYIYAPAKLDALESVGGGLYIYAPAKLDAPKLKSIGGGLYIYAPAKLDALESVGGDLLISAPAKLDALESVGGDLLISASAKLDAPKLKSIGGDLLIDAGGCLIAGKLYPGGYDKFTVIDGIGCVVLSEKERDGVTIRLCRHSEIKNQKVVGDKFVVASSNGWHAHGKTLAEATQELAFKTGSRDVSQWEGLPGDTIKTPEEWAFVYRMITGACRYGTEQFIASKGKVKKRYTLAEIVAETRGAFGHERFCEVVGVKVAA